MGPRDGRGAGVVALARVRVRMWGSGDWTGDGDQAKVGVRVRVGPGDWWGSGVVAPVGVRVRIWGQGVGEGGQDLGWGLESRSEQGSGQGSGAWVRISLGVPVQAPSLRRIACSLGASSRANSIVLLVECPTFTCLLGRLYAHAPQEAFFLT
jgi:hypothetical protein